MPAMTKRRRAAPATSQKSIQQFGKVSKTQPARSTAKSLNQKLIAHDVYTESKFSKVSDSGHRKRKAESIEEEAADGQHVEQIPPSTPRKKVRGQASVTETPTKGARSLFEAFNIASTGTQKQENNPRQLETPPSSQEREESVELPLELNELVDLHSCLLTALSLHYAHHGPTTPVDLRQLCPNVARVWRRRRVGNEDIQRLLPLQESAARDTFTLIDYGHGKICLEFVETISQKLQRNPVDEAMLNARVKKNLLREWEACHEGKYTVPVPADFVASLPLSKVSPSPSLKKIGPLLSKGQSRLTELKEGAIKAQERALSVSTRNNTASCASKPKSRDPFERSADLKSRIFARQIHQSTLPAPLSLEQLAHRSALLRLAEVAPVLESLALSGQKHRNDDADDDPFKQVSMNLSFTLPTLIQNIQMSLRNPIASDEAGRCVKLLGEVAPEWVGVAKIGKLVGVTVRGSGIGRVLLSRRVEKALMSL